MGNLIDCESCIIKQRSPIRIFYLLSLYGHDVKRKNWVVAHNKFRMFKVVAHSNFCYLPFFLNMTKLNYFGSNI
jgi:hypothetical protein